MAVTSVMVLGASRLGAFPLITNVVETGGDNEPTDTITAKWTGVTFPVTVNNEPVPGLVIGNPYTVGLFGNHAPAFVDRNHRYTNATPPIIPSYLVGQEYIMSGNDNRDNTGYRLDVFVATAVDVYMLIDNRLSDANNATPPTFDATHMQWVVDEGWAPVLNGLNRTANANVPDEVGIDESADGTINQWYSIYKKSFPAGSFQLKQADNAGQNMYGVVVVSVVPPSTPTNLVAVAYDAQVRLSWAPSAGATNYSVLRAESSGGPYNPLASLTGTSYTDTAVLNDTTYYYVVAAVNAAGSSPRSAEVSATPKTAPANVVAVGGVNQVTVTWDPLPNAESYLVKRATVSGGPYLEVGTGVTGTQYVDTTAQAGRIYYYLVQAALTGGGVSGISFEASALTAPSAPSLSATVFATTVLRLGWTTADLVVSQYVVEQSTDGTAFAPLATVAGTARSYTNGGLALGTTYFYRVQAQNGTGFSDYSAVASNTTPTFGVNVNFANAVNGQPANNPAPTPPGYVQDTGLGYGDRGNGYSYGWDRDVTPDGRWRQNAISPDLRYDTLVHFQKALPPAVWEIEIPNGFYQVHLVSGDPSNTDQSYQFDIEGVITPLIGSDPNRHWAEFTKTTILSDGRLTIRVGPDGQSSTAFNAKFAFIDIYAAVPEPVVIGTHPQPATVKENRPVSFSVVIASGSEPFFYQWSHDGVVIPAATNASYQIQYPSAVADPGGYSVVISNFAGSVTSAVALLTVEADNEPPRIVSVGSVDGVAIGVCFDEVLDQSQGTAIDPANYIIHEDVDLTLSSVTLRPDGKSVVLHLHFPINGLFTVRADNVQDYKGNGAGSSSTATSIVMNLTPLDIGTGTVGTPAGDPPVPGSEFTCTSNIVEVMSGGSDAWDNADHFRFLYRPVRGDFEATVQVTGLTAPDTITKAILMARETTAADSRHVHINLNPPAPARDQGEAGLRAATGGTTTGFGTNYIPVGLPNGYMRLTRQGDTFTTHRSTNGQDWLLFGRTVSVLPAELLVGIGVTAHTTNVVAGNYPVATGVFANFTVVALCAGAQPVLTNLSYSAGPPAQFSFQFASQTGCTYVVESKDNLEASSWTGLATLPGTGAVITVNDSGAEPKRFYRVRLQ